MATIGIVYSTASKIIRRIILPTNPATLGTHPTASGETMLVTDSPKWDLNTCKALVQQATGVAPASSFCAVIDGANNVVATVSADPALDIHPQGTLKSAPQSVSAGCTYEPSNQKFYSPQMVFPQGTYLPGIEDPGGIIEGDIIIDPVELS